MTNILVTASGSIGAINYVHALREAVKVKIVGTDYYPFNAKMNDLDVFYHSPKHYSPEFPDLINKIVETEKIDFVHPSIESEARVVAIHCKGKTFLPKIDTSGFCMGKHEICNLLHKKGLAVESFYYTQVKHNLHSLFKEYGSPLWVRLQTGAGARGGLACENPKIIHSWVKLMTMLKKGKEKDFIIQPYLLGPDYGFDSVWFQGKLLTSFAKERLQYLFPHLSLSGITGTPTVSKIVHNSTINRVATEAILEIDKEPHGIFCVDLKEHDGQFFVTEVNCKPHTTMFLWSFIASKMGFPERNLAVFYTLIGLSNFPPYTLPKYNLYPKNWIMLRHIDVGLKLMVANHIRGTW